MKFGTLDVVNPTEIDEKEFISIHRLNTFQPVGIDTVYPFGIPYLKQTWRHAYLDVKYHKVFLTALTTKSVIIYYQASLGNNHY